MPDFMKIDAARLEAAGTQNPAPKGERPDNKTVDEFRRSLEKPGATARDTDQDGTEPNRVSQLPVTPLESMFSGRMTATPAPPAQPEPSMPVGKLAEQLLERILVSRDTGGDQEVRLRLGSEILPGTEIRLRKGADGLLHVHLLTDNPASFQTLVAAQDNLKTRLEQLESHVRVDVSSESRGEDGDQNRRSRGYVPETEESR